MDLATANTDGIAVVLSRLPAIGVYTVKGESVEGKQGEAKEVDGAMRPGLISYNFITEVLEARLVDKNIDPITLVGRKLRDNYTLWPTQMDELIGLLKGRYQKVGLPHAGNMGGVPGAIPGWLDNMVGHIFKIRVYSFMSKGQQKVGFDWIEGVEMAEGEDTQGAGAGTTV